METSKSSQLPQFARMEAVRLIVSQTANTAAATYGLNVAEAAYVVEAVLGELRTRELAFGAAQMERAVASGDGGGDASETGVRPGGEAEAKAS